MGPETFICELAGGNPRTRRILSKSLPIRRSLQDLTKTLGMNYRSTNEAPFIK
jgi:hypothetical protein